MKSIYKVALSLTAGFMLAFIIASVSPAGWLGFAESILTVLTNQRVAVQTLVVSSPIALSAIGLTLAYRARFITIGAEGQLVAGAAAALWVSTYLLPGTEPAIVKSLSLLLAAAVGAGLGLAVAALRILLTVNEILSSLMLNYAVMYLVNHLVASYWRVGAFTITKPVPLQHRLTLPELLALTLILALLMHIIVSKTLLGYEAEALGRAPRAAKTYGVRPARLLALIASIQGAYGGLAGAAMMLGFQHTLTAMSTTPGYGYMGVLVAWLSMLNPLAALAASVFYAVIAQAARLLQAMGTPFGLALAVQAVILLSVVAGLGKTGQRW